jgi:hypothetical protein
MNPNAVDFAKLLDIWREECKVYTWSVEECRCIMMQIFSIVLGQCDPSMQACIKADAQWDDINMTCDVICLLVLICNCKIQWQMCGDDDDTLIEAKCAAFN